MQTIFHALTVELARHREKHLLPKEVLAEVNLAAGSKRQTAAGGGGFHFLCVVQQTVQ